MSDHFKQFNFMKYKYIFENLIELLDSFFSQNQDLKCNLIDVGCGRAFISIIVFLFFKNHFQKLILLDKKVKINKTVFTSDYFSGRVEMIENRFEKETLGDLIKKEEEFIFLGFHLCGETSTNFINCFLEFECLRMMFLVPCCFQSDCFEGSYEDWCQHLFRNLKEQNVSYLRKIESKYLLYSIKRFVK